MKAVEWKLGLLDDPMGIQFFQSVKNIRVDKV